MLTKFSEMFQKLQRRINSASSEEKFKITSNNPYPVTPAKAGVQ